MADLALQLLPNGKCDFVRVGGDLLRTTSVDSQVRRLLIQGTWIGDDGERAGKALPDLTISTSSTASQIQRIVETRLAVLIRSNALQSVRVVSVENTGDKALANIEIVEPGKPPQTIQIPLKA